MFAEVKGIIQHCSIPRLSLNKTSTVVGWFLVTCPWLILPLTSHNYLSFGKGSFWLLVIIWRPYRWQGAEMALGSRLIWCAKNLLKFVREHLIYLKGAKRLNSWMFYEKDVGQKFLIQRAKHCINKQLAIKKNLEGKIYCYEWVGKDFKA